jgi:hypothetical protein
MEMKSCHLCKIQSSIATLELDFVLKVKSSQEGFLIHFNLESKKRKSSLSNTAQVKSSKALLCRFDQVTLNIKMTCMKQQDLFFSIKFLNVCKRFGKYHLFEGQINLVHATTGAQKAVSQFESHTLVSQWFKL